MAGEIVRAFVPPPLPPDGDPTEYAKAFEAVYPAARHRRNISTIRSQRAVPVLVTRYLAVLWLPARSIAFSRPASIRSSTSRCVRQMVAKLHGDHRSIAIKNTGSELEQDARMRHVLVESGKRFGMIFVGYSGRDSSIMEALNPVLNAPSPFSSGLYWLTSSASRLLLAVIEFRARDLRRTGCRYHQDSRSA